jgi:hypothetical protein
MADGRSTRQIYTGGDPTQGNYGSAGDLTYEGIVGTGSTTIVLSTEVKPSTKGEGVLLLVLAAIESDGSAVDIDNFAVTEIRDPDGNLINNDPPEGCFRCYPTDQRIDFQESNAFGTPSPVPAGWGTYVFTDLAVGSTLTLTAPSPDSFGTWSVLDAIQSVAVVFTRPRALPAGSGVSGVGSWWFSDFYGARYGGINDVDSHADHNDCSGSLINLGGEHNSGHHDPFDIASDIGLILAGAKAVNNANPNSLIFFFSSFREPFDAGTVTWDFTDIIRFTGTLTVATDELPSGSFFSTWSISFGYRNVSASPVDFNAQWACPGHYTFTSGSDSLTFYRDVDVSVFVGTVAGGTGMPCCARGLIVSDRFRLHNATEIAAGDSTGVG